MPKQELNLFKFASSLMTKSSACATEIVGSDYAYATAYGSFSNDRPNHFRCETETLDLSLFVYGSEECSIL